MMKRLFLLLTGIWAFVFIANGLTKENGLGQGDLMLALAPLAVGWLIVRGGRFVVTGSPMKRPRAIPYRP